MSVLERGRERASINVCVREREGEGKYQCLC